MKIQNPKKQLFNTKDIENEIKTKNIKITKEQKENVNKWINKLNNGELKETAEYNAFSQYIMQGILEYDLEEIEFQKTIEIEGDTTEMDVYATQVPWELKGTNTKNLDKRINGMSPVEQATIYANKSQANWYVVTNYNEFRLYNRAIGIRKYANIFFEDLKNEETLKKFIVLFGANSFKNDIQNRMLKETKAIQRECENSLYKIVNETNSMLIKEFKEFNNMTEHTAEFSSMIFLNRYLQAAYVEDIGLIPKNSTIDCILEPIKTGKAHRSWQSINNLFEDMFDGEMNMPAFKIETFDYNKNPLDNFKVRGIIEDQSFFKECKGKWNRSDIYDEVDEMLGEYKDTISPIFRNLLAISNFDFSTELEAEIFGHVFEQVMNDKDNKKDGVYYTKRYIVEFIANHVIIPYLSKTGKANNVCGLINEYDNIDELINKLDDITVIDPACGSGAFLIVAVQVLTDIYEQAYGKKFDNNTISKYQIAKKVVENNIYGTDINKQSIELTKASLYITAIEYAIDENVKEFDIATLNNHIKAGNALVDDENIAENAFKWEKEFPEIFQNNNPGFKIVLANPPYNATIPQKQRTYQTNKYITGAGDTTIAFMHLIQNTLLNKNGRTGYIIPKSSVFTPKFQPIRENILQSIETIIDCEKVWNNVKLEQEIFIIDKNNNKDYYETGYRNGEEIIITNKISKNSHKTFELLLNPVTNKELKIGMKMKESNNTFGQRVSSISGQATQSKLSKDGDKIVIGGGQIDRNGFKGTIKGRINSEKIDEKFTIKDDAILAQYIIAHITNPSPTLKFICCIPEEVDGGVDSSLKQITPNENGYSQHINWVLMNSKAVNWYSYRFVFSQAIRSMNLTDEVLDKIAIPDFDSETLNVLDNMAKEMSNKIGELKVRKNKFITNITNNFENVNTNKKAIKEFETTTFTKFKNSLPTKLTLKQQEEWNEYLTETQKECQEIIKAIEEKENNINQLIYKAYGLNEEEIAIIENSY